MSGWLELLLANASAGDLDAHRAALLAGAPSGDQTRIEAEAAQARRLSELVRDQRRYAEELTVLNDLARSLGTLRDPTETLSEVAQQARRLLSVDVAYIMLLREDDKLRIETIDGTLGTSMHGIELARGEGLGGKVLASGAPLWTANYQRDDTLTHLSTTDSAAVAERLGGILGVPLLLGSQTIGVLLAADRTAREFSDREVTLLAALAAHAAISIRNSELYAQSRVGAIELATTNERLRVTSEAGQRSIELHGRLMDVVLRGGGLAQVASALESAVPAAISVYDEVGHWLADGSPSEPEVEHPDLPVSVRTLVDGADGQAQTVLGTGPGGRHVAVTPITLRESVVGTVVASGSVALDDESVRHLESAGTVMALTMATERAVGEAELRARGELISAVLLGQLDEDSLRRRARTAGVDLGAVRTVLVVEPLDGRVAAAAQLGTRLAHEIGGWSAEHAGQIVVLLRAADQDAVRARVGAPGTDLPGAVGIAACAGGPTAVRSAHQRAHQTTALLRGLGRANAVAVDAELGVFRSVFSHTGRAEVSDFVEATLGPLVEHDRQHRRDLVPTLEAYLGESRHHANTCARLHVHANTLYARLDRITEVLGEDWRTPDRSLDLQIALRMLRLQEQISVG